MNATSTGQTTDQRGVSHVGCNGGLGDMDPRTHWEHDGNLVEVAKHMRQCGFAWEPGVRLIGNCRACDIAQIAENFIADQELIAGLQNGDRVILPKTIEHARAMYLVAFNALQEMEPSSPNDRGVPCGPKAAPVGTPRDNP